MTAKEIEAKLKRSRELAQRQQGILNKAISDAEEAGILLVGHALEQAFIGVAIVLRRLHDCDLLIGKCRY